MLAEDRTVIFCLPDALQEVLCDLAVGGRASG